MALQVIQPLQAKTPLPSDIMARIAASLQQQAQARTQPLLQAQQIDAGRQQEALRGLQLQQEQNLAPLRQQQIQSQIENFPQQQKLDLAKSLASIGLQRAQAQELTSRAQKEGAPTLSSSAQAQQEFLSNLQKYGKDDVRTRTSAANLAKLTGFKASTPSPSTTSSIATPDKADTAPTGVNPDPANSSEVNSTITHANNKSQLTSPTDATKEVNQAIPDSNVATPEQIKSVQPIVKKQQTLSEQANDVLNDVTRQAQQENDPFLKAQAQDLSKKYNDVSTDAQQATEKELPLYKTLLDDLHDTKLVNPLSGAISWTTPSGQKFRADLVRAQGEFIKTFHLGRMTQREFNMIKNAIGTSTMWPSSLRKLFGGVISKDYLAQDKFNHYSDYVAGGGRKLFEADKQWEDKLPDSLKSSQQQSADTVNESRLKGLGDGVNMDQIHAIAKKKGISEERVIDLIGKG